MACSECRPFQGIRLQHGRRQAGQAGHSHECALHRLPDQHHQASGHENRFACASVIAVGPNRTIWRPSPTGGVPASTLPISFTMSLLRPCRQVLSKSVQLRAVSGARMYTNEGPTSSITQKPPADVVPGAPAQEVVAAELISGAPCEYGMSETRKMHL